MFSIILVIFSTTETENDSFLPPKAFFTLSFISFTDTITKFPPKNAPIIRLFQSTHPRRVWRLYSLASAWGLSFNQHTHEGCDWRWCGRWRHQTVSIHTPTKGVTHRYADLQRLILVSIHTPTKGVTISSLPSLNTYKFQSTHPRRVWLLFQVVESFFTIVSIHTPTKGVTILL